MEQRHLTEDSLPLAAIDDIIRSFTAAPREPKTSAVSGAMRANGPRRVLTVMGPLLVGPLA
jgi:hypothetical protein